MHSLINSKLNTTSSLITFLKLYSCTCGIIISRSLYFFNPLFFLQKVLTLLLQRKLCVVTNDNIVSIFENSMIKHNVQTSFFLPRCQIFCHCYIFQIYKTKISLTKYLVLYLFLRKKGVNGLQTLFLLIATLKAIYENFSVTRNTNPSC